MSTAVTESNQTRIRLDLGEDGRTIFIADDPSLPGCAMEGDTEEDALEALERARRVYRRHVPESEHAAAAPQWQISTSASASLHPLSTATAAL